MNLSVFSVLYIWVQLLLIVMKGSHHITWPWICVLAPMWLPVVVAAGALLLVILIKAIRA